MADQQWHFHLGWIDGSVFKNKESFMAVEYYETPASRKKQENNLEAKKKEKR